MKFIITILIFSLYSTGALSSEPKNCTEPTEHMKRYAGAVEDMVFGNVVEFKSVIKQVLLDRANEIERVVNAGPRYTGPDSEFIPRLIDLLEKAAGRKYEAECIWGLYQEGDVLVKFEDNESMVFRDGYALFRNGILVGYFYNTIGVV